MILKTPRLRKLKINVDVSRHTGKLRRHIQLLPLFYKKGKFLFKQQIIFLAIKLRKNFSRLNSVMCPLIYYSSFSLLTKLHVKKSMRRDQFKVVPGNFQKL
jgi:hypothetical protein